jgi:hypothetical protein
LQSLPPNGETDFGEDNISQMLEELKEIISKRAEKNISEIHFNNNNNNRTTHNNNDQINKASTTTNNNNNNNKTNNKKPRRKKKKGLKLQPRGGGHSGRFVLPNSVPEIALKLENVETAPKLEFGFKPLTTRPVSSSTTSLPIRFSLDPDADQVIAVKKSLSQNIDYVY